MDCTPMRAARLAWTGSRTTSPPWRSPGLGDVPKLGVQIGPPVGEQVVVLTGPLVPCQPQVDGGGQHGRLVLAQRPGRRVAPVLDDARTAYPANATLGV